MGSQKFVAVSNAGRVIRNVGWTVAALFVATAAGCEDECRRSENGCYGNIAKQCDTAISEGHSWDNPYIWTERDCTISENGISGACVDNDVAPKCVAADFTAAADEEMPFVAMSPPMHYTSSRDVS